MAKLAARAAKDLKQLPEPLQAKARELIGRLDKEPSLGKKLLGALQGLRTVRLGRTHRIIYRADDSGVTVLTVVPRKDAYR